jgi:hypothetical protein
MKGDYYQGLTKKPFGLEYVIANVDHWKTILLDGGKFYPYSALVTVAEIVALVALLALLVRGKTAMSRAEKAAFLIFTAVTGAMVAMYTSYFWGQASTATSTRFYALPFFFAGLLVPILLRKVAALRERADAVAVASALVFVFTFAGAGNRAFMNTIGQRKQHKIVEDLVFPLARHRPVLFVSGLPGEFHPYDIATISFSRFRRERGTIHKEIEHKLWDDVIVAQEVNLTTGKPSDATALPEDVRLEVIDERQYSGWALRISRLKHEADAPVPVDGPAVKEPENVYQDDPIEHPEHDP